MEEVVAQDAGDAQQQGGVDAFALEDGVHIGAFAAQLAGKPCHGAFLAVEFFFYQRPDVYHGGKQKKAEPFVAYLNSEVPPSTVSIGKYEWFTPNGA